MRDGVLIKQDFNFLLFEFLQQKKYSCIVSFFLKKVKRKFVGTGLHYKRKIKK